MANYMGEKGDELVIESMGTGVMKTYSLTNALTIEKVDMLFDSPDEAKKWAEKRGMFIVDEFADEEIDEDDEMKNGGKIKLRFEAGGVPEENEYEVRLRSSNEKYAFDNGFGDNHPVIHYSPSLMALTEYLEDTLPEDVEVVSINEKAYTGTAESEEAFGMGGNIRQLPATAGYKGKRGRDKDRHAKPVGWRYTGEGAKRLGVDPMSPVSETHYNKYKNVYFSDRNGKEHRYLYCEQREDRSDKRRVRRPLYEKGGITGDVHSLTDADLKKEVEKMLELINDTHKYSHYYLEADDNTLRVFFKKELTIDEMTMMAEKIQRKIPVDNYAFGEGDGAGTILIIDLESKVYFAKGGFTAAVTAIAKKLEGKKVPKEYQAKYGKKYTHTSAVIAAKKIKGAIAKKEIHKLANKYKK